MRNADTESEPPPRLLIVNYHTDTNRGMELLLFLSGFDAESVETIAAAKQRLQEQRYDLLICRNTASDGSGPRLIEHAWSRYRLPSIGMSGTLSKEKMMAEVTTPEAIKDMLLMPFMQTDVVEAIKKALPAHRLKAPSLRSKKELDQPQRCDDCRGSGHIDLLIRRVVCTRCNGRGEVLPDPEDLPLRHVALIPLLTRVALHRAGFHTLRHLRRATLDEIQTRAKLTDTTLAGVRNALYPDGAPRAVVTA